MREFDLNIERVLENWTVAHALREVIGNALDEQALTGTRERDFVFSRSPSSFQTTTEYVFKHALLRDVTYETVLLRDRGPLHRAAAQWIETVAGDCYVRGRTSEEK